MATQKENRTWDEWLMERENGELTKLKKLRSGITIDKVHVETLNKSASGAESVRPIMYFPSEVQDQPKPKSKEQ